MSDQPSAEDRAMMAKAAAQQAEADALLADPNVHTPTDPVDADQDPAGG
jgi:hypothetical protein